jgi:hypothetical protein
MSFLDRCGRCAVVLAFHSANQRKYQELDNLACGEFTLSTEDRGTWLRLKAIKPMKAVPSELVYFDSRRQHGTKRH